MPDPIELPFPLGGVSEQMALSKQAPYTTRISTNMRALNPATGEVTGARRSGLRALLADPVAAGFKVDFVGDLVYPEDLFTYTQLDNTPGSEFPVEWQELTPSRAEAYSAKVDRDGNLYVLEANGTVAVYNSAQERIGRIAPPAEGFESVVRTLAVDERSRVYIAAATDKPLQRSRIWRYSRDGDEDRWKQDWEFQADGRVIRIHYRTGSLVAGFEFDDEEDLTASILRLDVTGAAPLLYWDRGVPYPIGDVHIGTNGDVFYTSPANADRLDQGEFTAVNVGWTPYDLVDSDERIYFWTDAEFLSGYSSGDKVRYVPDFRFASVWDTDFTLALDDTDRYLQHKTGIGWNSAPTYRADAFGTKPGIQFGGSEVLRSRANFQGTNKAAQTNKLPKNRGPIPGVEVATWVTSMVIRLEPEDEPSSIFGLKIGGRLDLALLANADTTADPTLSAVQASPAPGKIKLNSQDIGTVTGSDEFDWIDNNGNGGNNVDCVLVTILHDGVTSLWRVNGVEIGTFPFNEREFYAGGGSDASVLLGGPFLKPEGQGSDPFGSGSGLSYFKGTLKSWITVLGTEAANPHDTAPTSAEIESIEGYLAHWNGISHILDPSHPYDSSFQAAIGFSGGTVPSEGQGALASEQPITAKYAGSSGALVWAIDGPGMGLGVTTDEEDGVFLFGRGDDRVLTADESPIVRKIVDAGTRAETGVGSTGTLTFTGNPLDTETATIGTKTYTFKTVLTPIAFEVLIGATAADTRDNLVDAINLEGDIGTDYAAGTRKHHQVDAVADDSGGTKCVVTAIAAGSVGDSIGVADTSASLDWGGETTLINGDAKGTWTIQDSRPGYTSDAGGEVERFSGAGARWVEADDEGDLYVTRTRTTTTAVGSASGVYKYDGLGNADGTGIQDWVWDDAYRSQFVGEHYTSFAFPASHPDYGNQGVTGPEFIYITGEGPEGDNEYTETFSEFNVHKLRLVSNVRSTAPNTRGIRHLAIGGGNLRRYDVGGSFTTVTGGAGAFSASGDRVVSAARKGVRFFSDGQNAVKYDGKTDTAEPWIAESGGEVPERIVELSRWRDRLVCISADDPHNWIMSRLGDPLDFDFSPEVATYEQAVSGESEVGLQPCPDIITAFMPYDQKTLYLGGDNTLHAMVGDPMAVAIGGDGQSYIAEISDKTGVARGASWTKDDKGAVYFFGNRGGLYRLLPGGALTDLSAGRIRRQLEAVDLTTYRIELVWNYLDRGIHIFQVPYGSGGTIVRHWFWEQHTGRWADGSEGGFWPDSFGASAVQPTSVAVLDGDDPDDRVIVLGCEDGRLRKWDPAAPDDDGSPIFAEVVSGPHSLAGAGMDGMLTAITPELTGDGAVDWEVYASQEPTLPDVAAEYGELVAGRNPTQLMRVSGAYVWVKYGIRSSQPWGHERTTMMVEEMGYSRRF